MIALLRLNELMARELGSGNCLRVPLAACAECLMLQPLHPAGREPTLSSSFHVVLPQQRDNSFSCMMRRADGVELAGRSVRAGGEL